MAKAQASRLGRASTTEDASPATSGAQDQPVSQPAESQVETGPSASVAEKPVKTVFYRGKTYPVIRTVRKRKTGAIVDYFTYDRPVRNRLTKETTTIQITMKKRRAGTGTDLDTDEDSYEG